MCLGSIGAITKTWEKNDLPMGLLQVSGQRDMEVCLVYTPEAQVGDAILAQLGFSVEILTPEAAADALAVREQAEKAWEEASGHGYVGTSADGI